MRQQLAYLFPSLLSIAKMAGDAIMPIYKEANICITTKNNNTPLTEADITSHKIIKEALSTLLPNFPIVSEENQKSQNIRARSNLFWLIDPLDGTKEFIAKNGEFTINIALIHKQKPLLGVVYAPVLNEIYWGGKNFGAFKKNTITSKTLQLKISQERAPSRIVVSKSHLNKETKNYIQRFENIELIQAGSSLKFCYIAENKADIYPRLALTCEWDTAAAHAVLEGAGGAVVQTNGTPLQYGKQNILNPYFVATANKDWINV